MPEDRTMIPTKVEVLPPSEIVKVQAEADIDRQVSTAKRYPRSIADFKRRAMELATVDQETAEECWYSLPRGGKVIEGPSIRFAEITASSYGNLRAETREIGEDDKSITAQASCWDLENNVAIRREVKRRIVDKRGVRYGDDMIATTSNAAASIALRNAIFAVVPKAIFKSVLNEVRKVAMGDERTLTATRVAIDRKSVV